MFARFRDSLARFMMGRYGMDTLNRVLFALSMVLYFINLLAGSVTLVILEMVMLWCMFFRFLSRNTYKRSMENRKFMELFGRVKQWILLQKNKIKYRKTHVYRACPSCKMVLRLPRKAGEHEVKCPRCAARFRVKV
ncbi:MAG: hypothetical protein IKU11_03590 [Clostridia bacterium]|nr:hypothetical protein [Clostridia bacterium]